jgi:hypothetical protein
MEWKQKEHTGTVERGDIYFFYHPKVETDDFESGHIKRFYMALSPEDGKKIRASILGRRRPSDPERWGKELSQGFVEMVRTAPEAIREALRGDVHETKTRGEPDAPAARSLGEGVYRIIRHGGHTHLAYAIHLPEETEEVREAFGIEKEASYILTIRNPEAGAVRAAGLQPAKKAKYPKHLRELFKGREFIDADPLDFLDNEGTEFLLIPASENLVELGLDPQKESLKTADIFAELRIDETKRLLKPLIDSG